MAKKRSKGKPADIVDMEVEISVSSKTAKLVDGIRKPFVGFVQAFTSIEAKRTDLCRPFMQAANAWMAETGAGFVDFVRYLQPEIGHKAAEYNAHPAYNAAKYLKRKAEQIARQERTPETEEQKAARQANAPAPPLVALSRAIATIIDLVPEGQRDKIRQALRAELRWSDKRVTSVFDDAVEHRVDPLVTLKAPKGQEMPTLKVGFPTPRHEEEAAHAKAA